ncbi:rod shape-determining protein MreC [uncultured Lamprocystis sp.]|uniref:rod shape-determining protein MreC n=1 Tax=uncultured Lamprocystis sp. TaxID=543132 RepID=UPI0025FF3FDA|nr:rod shape-determining protein MreC [uncultured Lamprocystis sp.]
MFLHGPSPTFRVILAVLMALGLIVADDRYQRLGAVRAAVAVVVYPLQLLADLPIRYIRGAQGRLVDERRLRNQNQALRRENMLLGARLQQLASLEAENMRLRDLLGSSFKIGERVLIAEILEVDLADYRQQVLINKGTNSGVYVGQPVLDANAVMGQVVATNPFSATVLLITDADHALPVQVNRNGLRTIAAGTGLSQELDLLHIPKNADIRIGDLLVTSGMGGRFPPGYPVARVTAVGHEPDNPFTAVKAEPTARLDRSREVLLVWTLTPDERPDVRDRSARLGSSVPGSGLSEPMPAGPSP